MLRDSASRRRGRARRAVTTGRVAPRGRSAKDKAPRAPLRRGPPREGQARNAMGLPTDCPADCEFAAWRWTQRWFGDCVCTSRDAASFTLGLVSVFAWGVAELLQIVTNFRNGTSEGVSFAFVATWLTGDALNLIGCAVEPDAAHAAVHRDRLHEHHRRAHRAARGVRAAGRSGEATRRGFRRRERRRERRRFARGASPRVSRPRRAVAFVDDDDDDTWIAPGISGRGGDRVCSSRPKRTPCGSAPRRDASRGAAFERDERTESFLGAHFRERQLDLERASERNRNVSYASSGATTDESFTARRRSRSEQARRRSESPGSAAAAALAAAPSSRPASRSASRAGPGRRACRAFEAGTWVRWKYETLEAAQGVFQVLRSSRTPARARALLTALIRDLRALGTRTRLWYPRRRGWGRRWGGP